MQHLDEGIIHAWIDGELPPDEASRVEAHASSCAACGAMVAEARGLVAASSRIASALDVTPGGVLPAFGARKAPRRWMTAKLTTAIAATLVFVAGTVMTMRGRAERSRFEQARDTNVAVAPVVKPASNPPIAIRPEPTPSVAAAPKAVDRPTSPMPVAKRGDQMGNVVAAMTAPSLPVPAADSLAKVVAQVQVDTTRLARSAASPGRIAGAMSSAGAAAGVAEARSMSPRKSVAVARSSAPTMDAVSFPSYAGCYELNESTDVLPKRFALRADSARAGLYEVRYVDSSGFVDGRMVDAGWMETGGRAVIRTAGLGEILTIVRTGNAASAQSPLGPRTVRVTTCR
jgi:hypothetical protein